ncbi:hypothetical protein MARINOS108_10425 [Marinoscillum sp. 108]|nr:hypothetical protein MARINOS108_10425 [Marinoscillum sp. 108]
MNHFLDIVLSGKIVNSLESRKIVKSASASNVCRKQCVQKDEKLP